MKLALMNYYDISPKQVTIIREKGMKPYFKYDSESDSLLHFNVSHDGDVVVIILSKYMVGIDIMKTELSPSRVQLSNNIMEANEKFLNNMKNVFHPSEWEYIQKDISKFMHYWTIKESFVKYIGLGLYVDPRRLLIDSSLVKENHQCNLNSPYLKQSNIYLDNQLQVRKSILLNISIYILINATEYVKLIYCLIFRIVRSIHLTKLFPIIIFLSVYQKVILRNSTHTIFLAIKLSILMSLRDHNFVKILL